MLPPLPASARRAHERRAARVLVPDREIGHGPGRPTLLDVLQAARQDAFDLALEPERGAPHDGLIGRVEPVETGLGDDLVHRAGLRHRLLERPPVGGQHRPDHRAGHRHRRHRLGEADDHDAAGDRGHADQGQAGERDVQPGDERDDAGRRWPGPRVRSSARRPCSASRRTSRGSTTWSSSALSKAATSEPNLGRSSGVMKSPSSPTARPRRRGERDFLGRADRAARVAGALRLDRGVARVGTRCRCRPSCSTAEPPGVLAEGDQAARREVEHRRGQRAPRRAAVHDHRAGRGGQVGRRGRHQDRRRRRDRPGPCRTAAS